MNLNSIIFKNFFKNISNYILYIFALVFSVALYFSFVLMSKDKSVQEELASGNIMPTGFLVGSVLLIFIIVAFVMFANAIFLKRRNKEIALFQLIGLNRNKVFRILLLENAMIYFGSLVIGIGFGFLISRMLLMILLRAMQIDLPVGLNFSMEAVLQTAVLYIVIFLLLMIQNFLFLKGTSLIKMLNLDRASESGHKKHGNVTVIFGTIGLLMIISGYWLSTKILDYPLLIVPLLFVILFLTIIGTYITFKFSVAFIFDLIRKSKGGHVNVNDVLSLTSIMFKMKSNAFLLTLISVVSALSMGLMSLSYISYFSVDKMVEVSIPEDYIFFEEAGLKYSEKMLQEEGIGYETVKRPLMEFEVKDEGAVAITRNQEDNSGMEELKLNVISDESVDEVDVGENEAVVTGVQTYLGSVVSFETGHPLTFHSDDYERTVELMDVESATVLPSYISFGLPTVIVDDSTYEEMFSHYTPDKEYPKPEVMYGLNITGDDSMDIYNMMDIEEHPGFESKISLYTNKMQGTGMMMFIIGFVGFAFLLTSGCILYFKQIGESEDENGSYSILRKLGFSEKEIMKGLSLKMAITFGIPLLIGLLHTYFAVKAGWFLFGMSMWTPMLTVMGGYLILYSVFGVLSLLHYRKVVRQSM